MLECGGWLGLHPAAVVLLLMLLLLYVGGILDCKVRTLDVLHSFRVLVSFRRLLVHIFKEQKNAFSSRHLANFKI